MNKFLVLILLLAAVAVIWISISIHMETKHANSIDTKDRVAAPEMAQERFENLRWYENLFTIFAIIFWASAGILTIDFILEDKNTF